MEIKLRRQKSSGGLGKFRRTNPKPKRCKKMKLQLASVHRKVSGRWVLVLSSEGFDCSNLLTYETKTHKLSFRVRP